MRARPRPKIPPITIELLEKCLDRLALIAERAGPVDGPKVLPIYQRLEDEIAKLRATEDAMARVKARLADARARGAFARD